MAAGADSVAALGEALRRLPQLARRSAGPATLILGLAYALAAGVFADGPARGIDAKYLQVFGACFRTQTSPYAAETYRLRWEEVFHEPARATAQRGVLISPLMGVVAAPISALPWHVARSIYDSLNCLFGLGLVLYFSARLAIAANRRRRGTPRPWIGLGAACLISAVPAALFLGQTTLWALAGVLGVAYFHVRGRVWASALCVLAAAAKPPVAVLPLLYVLLAGGHRAVLLGTGGAAALSLAVLSHVPYDTLLRDILGSLDGYSSMRANRPPAVTGMPTLLYPLLGETSAIPWIAAGLVSVLAIGMASRRSDRVDVQFVPGLYLSLALTGLLVPLKVYDGAIFAPWLVCALAGPARRSLTHLPGLVLAARPGLCAALLAKLGVEVANAWVATLGAGLVLLVLLHPVRGRAASGPPRSTTSGKGPRPGRGGVS